MKSMANESSNKNTIIMKVMKYVALIWSRKFWLLFLGAVAAVCAMLYFYSSNSHGASATLSLRYEKAYDGLYPNGTRFNIYDLKSDDVLSKTIERLGLSDQITINQLSGSLALSPASAQNVYNKYIATDYTIYLSDAALPKGYNAANVLNVLMDVYTQVFHRNYATNDDSLELDWTEVEDWDYLDFGSFMTVKINRLITYLDEMKNSSGMSQYSLEGETFSSLRASIVNFRDIYLAEFNAFVNEKRLFKDPQNYREKLDYRRFLLLQEMEEFQSEYTIRQEALTLYDKSMITFVMVPMYDYSSGLYMARTAIGTDNLASKSANYASSLSNRQLKIAEIDQSLSRVKSANTATADLAWADKMIENIKQQIDSLIVRVRTVTKDYESSRSKNDISYYVNSRSFMRLFEVKNAMMAGAAVMALAAMFYCVYFEVRKETK